MNRSKLLAATAILFGNGAFLMAITYSGFAPPWIASYVGILLLYSALYFSRLRRLPEALRCRLRKAAATLVLFLTALFFYNFASEMSWWVAGATWLGLAAAAYLAYDIMFQEEEAELLQGSRPQI